MGANNGVAHLLVYAIDGLVGCTGCILFAENARHNNPEEEESSRFMPGHSWLLETEQQREGSQAGRRQSHASEMKVIPTEAWQEPCSSDIRQQRDVYPTYHIYVNLGRRLKFETEFLLVGYNEQRADASAYPK